MSILVADDDPVTRLLLTKTLNKWGYEVLTASDGLEALEILKKNEVRIVITDWMMPNMDGLALCNEIRSLSTGNYVYIIIVTSRDQKKDLNEAFEKGVDDYIIKPIDIERLKTSLYSASRIISLSENLNNEIDLHKKTAERMNAILEYSSDIIYTLDLNGNFTSVNKVAKELTGYTEEELLNINFRDFIPQKNQDEIKNVFNSIYKTGTPLRNYPFEVSVKDGTTRYFETSVGLIQSGGNITGFQGSSKDITQRVYTQIALQESERENRMLIESMKEGLLKIDEKGILIFVNDSLCKILGYSKEELLGQYVMILHEKEEEKKMHERLLRRKQGISDSYEMNYITKGGQAIPTIVSAKPVFTSDGKYDGTVVVITDISSVKQAEKERKAIEAQLRQSDKMASIGQLAAGVAHEINNPTGFVRSNLNTLSTYINDYNTLITLYQDLKNQIELAGKENIYKGYIQKINAQEEAMDIAFIMDDISNLIHESREGTERIKKIVQDLKDFAHPGEDKPKYADVNRCIESTLNIVWNEIKYKAQIVKDYGQLPDILCYPQQLNQVFANILVNAAQAITDHGEISIKTSLSDKNIEIIINDTGCGISKDNLFRIFDPFFTTKDVGKGTGLGLNVAYNIIKKHNGEITVRSEEGHGTAFTVIIPVNNTDEKLNSGT